MNSSSSSSVGRFVKARAPNPLSNIIRELQSVKYNYLHRIGPPDALHQSTFTLLTREATNLVAPNINTDAHVFNETGEFVSMFAYLTNVRFDRPNVILFDHLQMNARTEMFNNSARKQSQWGDKFSSSPTGNTDAVYGRKKNKTFPDTDELLLLQSEHRHRPVVSTFAMRRPYSSVVNQQLLPAHVCQSVFLLIQQYISAVVNYDGDGIRPLSLGATVRASLMLRERFSYAFPHQHELEAVDNAINAAYSLMHQYISRNREGRSRQQQKSSLVRSDVPLVTSKLVIDALETTALVKGKSIRFNSTYSSHDNTINDRRLGLATLLPFKSLSQMEHKKQLLSSEVDHLFDVLLKQEVGVGVGYFGSSDANMLVHVLHNMGIRHIGLLDKSIECASETVHRNGTESRKGIADVATFLIQCGTLSVVHPKLSRMMFDAFKEVVRPDSVLLTRMALALAMTQITHQDGALACGLPPATILAWWKSLVCKVDHNHAVFSQLASIGHSLGSIGLVSSKANHSLCRMVEETVRQEEARQAPSFLASEPLPVLLKAMYLLGSTRYNSFSAGYESVIRRTTERIATAATSQVEGSITFPDDVVSVHGTLMLDTVLGSHWVPRDEEDARRKDQYRRREAISLGAQYAHAMAHCKLRRDQLSADIPIDPDEDLFSTCSKHAPVVSDEDSDAFMESLLGDAPTEAGNKSVQNEIEKQESVPSIPKRKTKPGSAVARKGKQNKLTKAD